MRMSSGWWFRYNFVQGASIHRRNSGRAAALGNPDISSGKITQPPKIMGAACIIMVLSALPLVAQQITRFGVVDTAKVYGAYFKNSAAVRNYEKKKAEAQEEITRRTEEIRALKDKKTPLAASEQGKAMMGGADDSASGGEADDYAASFLSSSVANDANKKLDDEIARKTKALTDYAAKSNQELEAMRRSMQNSDAFYKKLYTVIARVAEQGGYSAILSLQQADSVLWYSPSVDITEDVIKALAK